MWKSTKDRDLICHDSGSGSRVVASLTWWEYDIVVMRIVEDAVEVAYEQRQRRRSFPCVILKLVGSSSSLRVLL